MGDASAVTADAFYIYSKMKKDKKRKIPDYNNKYTDTMPEYYGVFIEKKNKRVESVKIDPKRLKKLALIDDEIYKEIQSIDRNTPYFHPAKKLNSEYSIDVFRGRVERLRKLWIQEIKPAIEKLQTPQEVGNAASVHYMANGLLDADETGMVRTMETLLRAPAYKHAIDMFYAQFILLIGSEIEAVMVKVITDKGYTADKFSREHLKSYVSGRVAGLDYTKLESHVYYDKLYKLWNLLKHNNIDVYSKVKDSYPELLTNNNLKYESGDLAIWHLNLSEELIFELMDGVTKFFDEFCTKVFGEITDYPEWNTEAFYVNLVKEIIEDITNPMGLPWYV